MTPVQLIPLTSIPQVLPGDDLADLVAKALSGAEIELMDGDVLVVAQKIFSKAEGRSVRLSTVTPSAQAQRLAAEVDKDPRLVELILQESRSVVRAVRTVLIVEHRLGFIMANAGIDQSNVDHRQGETALLLPEDPDASCERLRAALEHRYGTSLAVVMNDSFGRPWRNGVAGVCIGAAGLPALLDRRGCTDLFGRPLQGTEIAVGDEVAAAASLLMGQADEGVPAVLLRGLRVRGPQRPASALIRSRECDLFR
jgi:coenzyme F420-0:L-glutamate ligase/coenzyme F420-1:gamma-L-glutamate ligase